MFCLILYSIIINNYVQYYNFSRMSEVFKRNKKHNKRQSAGTSRKKGNQDNEINDLQTIASSSGGNIALIPNSGQSITLHEFFISKGKCFFFYSIIYLLKYYLLTLL